MIATLLLTAGLGTRLDPLTRLVAKPAMPLDEQDARRARPDRSATLRASATSCSTFITGLPASRRLSVTARHLGLPARYSWEQPLLGSAGGPRHALGLLTTDPFLIVNGDTLCDVDIRAMLSHHASSGAVVTMAVVPNPAPDHYNGVALGDRDEVTAFVPRGQAEGTWHFVGFQIAEASVFQGLTDGVPTETVAGIYRELVAARPGALRGFRLDTPFLDVGTPRDYLDTALVMRPRAAPPPTDDREAGVSRSVIWSGARVAPGATLDNCIVAGQVSVPPGFRASSKVIVPASIATPDDDADIRDGMAIFALEVIRVRTDSFKNRLDSLRA